MCVSLILSFMPMKTGSPISKLVLLKLADNADARGVCFPSLNYLAQYCEVSVRTVKRHVNELEKQGFVKRIKRFDDSGRQRSNIYQLRLPGGCHIEQNDLEQTGLPQALPKHAPKTGHTQKNEHSDTHLGDTAANTESDHLSHIIFHKEHKTDIPVETNPVVETKKIFETAPTLEAARSFEKERATPPANGAKPTSQQNEAVIHLLTKEGNAPIYHEFYKILERTYPKLDVLQELHAMQTWLYINPDKRKPFEHIGHFVNGWLRRSAQAKAKRDSSPVFKQTKAVKPSKKAQSIKAVGSRKADVSTAASNQAQPIKSNQAESKSQNPTPVSQALADYKAKSTTNPFEARIKALVQSKSSSADSKQ
ncbi:helix-turn-helix domain-containing protein [Vibrio crassostreae]|uniref:helix-turn-helix domain-containing protein n=1 Tax=Vibrio crassostreae TaxID=246167 RepID=UPI000F4892FC|nr:helix-turn-helix domain-containing protein [Vibrio crassostreae]ROO48920.1 helix-turn-helix protein [Vibrio crassostreae]ROO49184.1 helix-turn-helix protein [Vibrio crassostreae]ROO66462.1 helix-turn-helix protein [Vibrio crassostreae]ROO68286.1 helix-turn-helix protein [Vibrio crassostreae]ROR64354.1 helix-turn-helix protein [Vibrio crassostreae]